MTDERLEKARQRLLREIAYDARDTASWTGRRVFSERVMTAMESVPRHEFVRPEDRVAAYVNRPQRIGHGQTISQPYIVALMTDLLDLEGDETILEIGAGCGYQAAVLATVAEGGHVYSIETVEALAEGARKRLDRLGYSNIDVRSGDGYGGWPEEAPFDAVIVTAAPERIPETLVEQMKPGGRMVIPIGRAHSRQMLILLRKDRRGRVSSDKVLPVAFVPLVPREPLN